MKWMLLATALAFGSAASAQDAMTTTPATPQTEMPAPPSPATPTPEPMQPATPTPPSGDDPVGGYQPPAPPMSVTPAPGQQVIFNPSPTPAQAYPPPPPLQSYPICKKGQYDNCRQRGG